MYVVRVTCSLKVNNEKENVYSHVTLPVCPLSVYKDCLESLHTDHTCCKHTHSLSLSSLSLTLSVLPRTACYFNKEMMMHYHPGALLRNSWTCCKQTGKTSLGCQPTYYLLTRSSSRYAQMRRKDTLTSSQGSQGRKSKSTSVPREERMSRTPVPSRGGGEEEEGGGRGSGRGLSNSCFDLTRRQIQNSFEPVLASVEVESRCSSQLSTEPSISMGCITLTRLSLSESATPLSPPIPTPKMEVAGRSPVVGAEGKGVVKRNRVQVAPEYTPTIRSRITFPSSESQPHLAHQTTLPVLPNRFTHSASSQFTTSGHTPSQATPTGQTKPLLPPPVAYHCLTEPRRSRRKTHPGPPPPPSTLSTSLSHLCPQKPVLEPKVSVTDPNTIHV